MPITSRFASAAARAYGMFRIAAGAVVDPFFNYVTALLHGDGTNGAQNNTFLDSSTNNFTITRNGNTTQGTFSPFSQTGWSNYFNGTSAYLTTPVFGAGNGAGLFTSGATFTVETWLYQSAFVTTSGYVNTIIGDLTPTTATALWWAIGTDSSNAPVLRWYDGAVKTCTGSVALPINTWNHVAFVCNAGTFTIYVNGVSQTLAGTTTITTPTGTTGNLYIGADRGNYVTGYASNLRVVKNSAVYTANFTPSTTPLTAITNTQLLTCQANRFLDASTNAYAITSTNASVQAFSPFNPTSAWSASSNGGSGYFDGSGDYLTAANSTAFALPADFTVEAWVYFNSNTTSVFCGNINSSGYGDWAFFYNNAAGLRWLTGNGTTVLTAAYTMPLNAWTHVAISRSGTDVRFFANGALLTTVTNSSSNTFAGTMYIGSSNDGGLQFPGYMSNLRIVKGTAVYTAAFTPPTAPLTAITNTSLLLNYTNAGIYDNAAVGDYETVGNAQVSTSVKKYGTGSIYLDGTGDYLDTPSNNAFTFGTGDFTIEFWLNTSSTGFNIMNPATATGTGYWGLLVQTSNLRWNSAYNVTNLWLVDATPILNGQWNHVAICRTAGVTKAFFNGTVVATNADTTNYNGVAAWRIGSGNVAALNGYIDDFRITKYARYQYNFTPPTAAFPNIGGTVTLTADPYYNYTTLLLPGNGTNGAQNNTFLDSSSNAFTITRNGNTTQGNFSPFSQTGWGNYFGGSSDYINFASSSALSFASDFTVEAWVYNNYSTGTFNPAVLYDSSSSAISSFEINNGTNYPSVAGITATNTVTRYTFSTGPSVPVLQWVHVAWVRSSGTVKVYVNGTASTATLSNSAATGQIVQVANGRTSGSPWNGYISNLRITSSAVYTSNFTPSSVPLTAISGTQLLTCQANRFVDASSNALSPTLIGSPTVQAFSPFAPTAAWSASTNGGSGYFDGSGDYLSLADNAAFQYGTGDFTIEFWFYMSATAGSGNYYVLYDGRPSGTSGAYVNIAINNATPESYVSGSTVITGSALSANTWYHFAYARSGTSTKMFVNGTQVGSTYTDTTNYVNGTSRPVIGTNGFSVGTSNFNGYLSNYRVVKGTAVYTANFTPPTAPLTAISGTSLLLSATNGGIVDATAKNDLETVGNAQISTTQSKFGGSSIYLDGNGDRLIQAASPNLALGSGDFTIECWLRRSSLSSLQATILQMSSGADSYSLLFGYTSSPNLVIYISSNGSSWDIASGQTLGTVQNDTWVHYALTRYGSTFRAFQNGVQQSTWTSSSSIYQATNQVSIGYAQATHQLAGYINDLRITKGIARYTSNFTPPTSAFLTL